MAAKKVVTLGLSSIEFGAIANDGDMGTTLASVGYTYEDTCSLTMEDPSTTEFYAEEVDDPIEVITKAGKITVNFSIMNPDVNVLAQFIGGTATAATASTNKDTWTAPATFQDIELSCKINSKKGFSVEIPRLKVFGKINATFSKKNILLLEVSGTVLTPTKAGVAKAKFEVANTVSAT